MVDKQKAIQLRQEGKSYKEIAEELSCSEAWCKLNLKGVVKNTQEASAIRDCVRLAQRKEGITAKEIFSSVDSIYTFSKDREGDTNRLTTFKRFKEKILKAENTIIRPYWMKPKESVTIFQRVLQIVNTMDNRLYEELKILEADFGLNETYTKSLSYIVGKLSYAGSLGTTEPLSNRLKQLEQVANKLYLKNKDGIQEIRQVQEIKHKVQKPSKVEEDDFFDCNLDDVLPY